MHRVFSLVSFFQFLDITYRHYLKDFLRPLDQVLLVHQFLIDGAPDVTEDFSRAFPATAQSLLRAVSPRADEMVRLPVGAMGPCSARATLHTEAALWGLLIPASWPSVMSDIVRGYMTQRLLWEIGGEVAFRGIGVTRTLEGEALERKKRTDRSNSTTTRTQSVAHLEHKVARLLLFLGRWDPPPLNAT